MRRVNGKKVIHYVTRTGAAYRNGYSARTFPSSRNAHDAGCFLSLIRKNAIYRPQPQEPSSKRFTRGTLDHVPAVMPMRPNQGETRNCSGELVISFMDTDAFA